VRKKSGKDDPRAYEDDGRSMLLFGDTAHNCGEKVFYVALVGNL
jgi:hypothetical protein